jgi:hypothetical protein
VVHALELDAKLATRNVGWHHESFIVAHHIKPSLCTSEFTITVFSENLFDCSPDIDRLNFALAQQKGGEEAVKKLS